ncbi:MAG: helicase-exonuclease AddAB subunit AddA [Epulopiscium sp. Nele67-Bin004]|nr:MAG: helicase-exonuclease AddAB subunit AddA [Epulopiscium sp. Nele67-Bin004]
MADWTTAQQKAIDTRDKNILVSAAAGSGKTAVLSERVVKKIVGSANDAGVSVDKFLIVTFTNLAAQEMKERIEHKLNEELGEIQDNGKTLEHYSYLEKQISLLPKSSISTIHSFCQKTIKQYFNELDIDPNMRIGQDIELKIMQNDIIEEVIEEAFEQGTQSFFRLADTYGSVRGMDALALIVRDIYTFTRSLPNPNKWLDEQVNKLLNPCDDLDWKKILTQEDVVSEAISWLERALVICRLPDGPSNYVDTIESEIRWVEEMGTWPKNKLPQDKQSSKSLREQVQDIRKQVKKLLETQAETEDMFAEANELEKYTIKIGELFAEIVNLMRTFEQKYSEAKKERGLLDYADLEHMMLKLLVDSDGNYTQIAKELSTFYDEIYIDEYQDVNDVQETILSAIAEASGTPRFMVGDMKQSIYRFRLANPQIFSNKYTTYPKDDSENDICINLSENFRSKKVVLDYCNQIFQKLMSEQVGDLEYDEDATLKEGNKYEYNVADSMVATEPEVIVIETNTQTAESEEDEDFLAIELEAKMVAQKIKLIVDGKANPKMVYDKENDDYREVQAKDIVILLRAKSNANLFAEALSNVGLDSHLEGGDSFFDAAEVELMFNYIKIIDNPLQDIPLLSVLRSPIVNLTYEDLAKIRHIKSNCPFYEAFVCYVEQHQDEKLLNFKHELEYFRELSKTTTVEELISRIYKQTGYYRYVGMLDGGETKQANLRLLKKEALRYEENSKSGLFNFVTYLQKVYESEEQINQAKVVANKENVIKKMTIHKSKGLEFPVVFLSHANKQFNQKDTTKTTLVHSRLGFGSKYRDTETYIEYETIPYMAIKRAIKNENISEEMRVLYVALTRAREKLYITGQVKNNENFKAIVDLYNNEMNIDAGLVRKSNNYLDWLVLSGIKNITYMTKADLNKADKAQPQINNKVDDLLGINITTQYGDHKKEIYDKLNYMYVHQCAVGLPQKVSVTKLKNELMPEKEIIPYVPKFALDDTPQGAVRGTIIHGVFEHLDYINITTAGDIKSEIQRLIANEQIVDKSIEVIDISKMVSFANSDVINRMRQAQQKFKEQPFVYTLDSKRVDANCTGEKVLIQGIVDACFIENNEIVLIDYKSDYVDISNKQQSINNIAERYKVQVDLYGEALGDIMGKSVAQKWIYLYSIDEWIMV